MGARNRFRDEELLKRFRLCPWAPILRKQHGFKHTMDIYWDDYYRGVKEGYFTEAQRVKIESLLKAYPLESKERRDNFNTFFLNNIERIIPAQSLILNLEVQLGNKLRSYIFKSVTETEIILENLK